MTHQTSVTKHKDLHKGLVFVVMWSEPLEIGKSDISLSGSSHDHICFSHLPKLECFGFCFFFCLNKRAVILPYFSSHSGCY